VGDPCRLRPLAVLIAALLAFYINWRTLARSELARTEGPELFDMAWKNVSAEDNGGAIGVLDDDVDAIGNMGENGITDEDTAEEAGR